MPLETTNLLVLTTHSIDGTSSGWELRWSVFSGIFRAHVEFRWRQSFLESHMAILRRGDVTVSCGVADFEHFDQLHQA